MNFLSGHFPFKSGLLDCLHNTGVSRGLYILISGSEDKWVTCALAKVFEGCSPCWQGPVISRITWKHLIQRSPQAMGRLSSLSLFSTQFQAWLLFIPWLSSLSMSLCICTQILARPEANIAHGLLDAKPVCDPLMFLVHWHLLWDGTRFRSEAWGLLLASLLWHTPNQIPVLWNWCLRYHHHPSAYPALGPFPICIFAFSCNLSPPNLTTLLLLPSQTTEGFFLISELTLPPFYFHDIPLDLSPLELPPIKTL